MVGQWRGNPSFLSIWNKPIVKLKKVVENTKKNVNIPTHKAVREYILGMEGTDCIDQNITAYRVSIRGKNGGGLYLHGFWMLVWEMLGYFVK